MPGWGEVTAIHALTAFAPARNATATALLLENHAQRAKRVGG
jgi:hypothetical protein